MKVVTSGKTDKFSYAIKLSDERLKLFLDVAPLPPPPPAEPEAKPESLEEGNKESETPPKEPAPPPPPPEPVQVSKQDILDILPKEVWEGCLHQDVLENIAKELSRGDKIEERRIAKGIAAEDGADGRFIITVKKMSPKPDMQEDIRGFVDFKDLHRFENIRTGTVVAKILPPTAGKPGTDPLGKSIPAKNGQPVKINFDESITAKNHPEGGGQDLVAAIDGFLADENGRLSIQQELRVSGAIDYKIGSIDFIGSVYIQGDVLPGFIVRGKKGVVIKGAVEEATVSSSEGAVEIFGYCTGSISSKIEAKTNLYMEVANQVEMQAGISIQIIKEARDCRMRSGGTVTGAKAAVIGGLILCASGVEAREIGARDGATTDIQLSSDVGMTREYVQNEQLIADHEKILVLLRAHLGPLATTEAGLANLSPKHRDRVMPILSKKRSVESSLVELRLKREELVSKAHTNEVFKINFLEKLHAGVVVKAGETIFSVKDEITGPQSLSYNAKNKSFELGELSALECSLVDQSKESSDDSKHK